VFVGGRLGVWLEKQGQAALTDFAIDRIADIFGSDIRKRVKRCIATAWEGDPWTRGTWACARPGHAHQRAQLARPLEERLFFAGEATDRGGQGTCHGAYNSGLRAACEIAETLQLSGNRR
jgi:monoamine oxidase